MGEEHISLTGRLSANDCRALDAWMARHTGDAAGDAASHEAIPSRSAAVERLMALVGACPAEDPPSDLSRRTVSQVLAEEQRRRFAYQISTLAAAPPADTGRFQIGRWMEIAVGAAMIIVGISLALPVLNHNRAEARRIGCATNLARASTGFGQYAASHNNTLPRVQGVKPGDVWIRVGESGPGGKVQSNSAHLFVLVRGGYVTPQTLACPENASAMRHLGGEDLIDWPNPQAPSYSYPNQHTPYVLRIDRYPHKPVLADRNPLFEARNGVLMQNISVAPTSPSRQHGQTGQNILTADGAVKWRYSPVMSDRDNIWTADGIERYTGTEVPAREDDAHLVP